MRRNDCSVVGRWELGGRNKKKRVNVSSKIRSNILFTIQQTLMGVSNQEWGWA
jgi:hypothetical protein